MKFISIVSTDLCQRPVIYNGLHFCEQGVQYIIGESAVVREHGCEDPSDCVNDRLYAPFMCDAVGGRNVHLISRTILVHCPLVDLMQGALQFCMSRSNSRSVV